CPRLPAPADRRPQVFGRKRKEGCLFPTGHVMITILVGVCLPFEDEERDCRFVLCPSWSPCFALPLLRSPRERQDSLPDSACMPPCAAQAQFLSIFRGRLLTAAPPCSLEAVPASPQRKTMSKNIY